MAGRERSNRHVCPPQLVWVARGRDRVRSPTGDRRQSAHRGRARSGVGELTRSRERRATCRVRRQLQQAYVVAVALCPVRGMADDLLHGYRLLARVGAPPSYTVPMHPDGVIRRRPARIDAVGRRHDPRSAEQAPAALMRKYEVGEVWRELVRVEDAGNKWKREWRRHGVPTDDAPDGHRRGRGRHPLDGRARRCRIRRGRRQNVPKAARLDDA